MATDEEGEEGEEEEGANPDEHATHQRLDLKLKDNDRVRQEATRTPRRHAGANEERAGTY